jgi:hypothetical protein
MRRRHVAAMNCIQATIGCRTKAPSKFAVMSCELDDSKEEEYWKSIEHRKMRRWQDGSPNNEFMSRKGEFHNSATSTSIKVATRIHLRQTTRFKRRKPQGMLQRHQALYKLTSRHDAAAPSRAL